MIKLCLILILFLSGCNKTDMVKDAVVDVEKLAQDEIKDVLES